jgi:Uma2 family endonuclease
MATVLNAPGLITPEEFLKLPDRDLYELVDGQLVETTMSMEAALVAGEFLSRLRTFVKERSLGGVYSSDATYQCFPDAPGKVRRPDVSFVARGRLSEEQFSKGHCPIPPDLAVEVISPNDLFYDVEEKVEEYRSAGVRLVWVASPKSRSITVYRLDGTDDHFGVDALLTGESVVPGFEVRVEDLFPNKADVI